MATHSSILARRIPWTEEPSGLQSIESQRVRLDWGYLACLHACNQNLPTPRTGNESLSYQQGCCGEESGYWTQTDSLRKEGRTKTDIKREARRLEAQPQVHWKDQLPYSTRLIASYKTSYKTLTDVCLPTRLSVPWRQGLGFNLLWIQALESPERKRSGYKSQCIPIAGSTGSHLRRAPSRDQGR